MRARRHAQYHCHRHGVVIVTWETTDVPLGLTPRCRLLVPLTADEKTVCNVMLERKVCTDCE